MTTTGSAAPRGYHHGDLRQAILAAALDAIRAEGPGALSLRDLARRAGVSHAAPAHHFKDRAGLLTAIAAEGHHLLAESLADSLADAPTGADGLREAGVRYVRFATRHPAHFQVMFRPELYRADDPELVAAKDRSTRELRAAVAPLGADPELAGVAAWSLAHGFATLLLTHNLERAVGEGDPEDVFRTMAEISFTPSPARTPE